MKAERRHDLKTNELADWLAHFPEFWHQNYRIIIYVTIVVVLVTVTVYFKWYRKRVDLVKNKNEVTEYVARVAQAKVDTVLGMNKGVDYSDRLLATADALDTVSKEVEDASASAFALCKRAEALRAELHYRSYSLEPQAAEIQIEQARRCYEAALVKGVGNAGLEAMAELGLGLCAEELGDVEKAKDIYQKIVDSPDYQGTVFVSQARQRLETIDEYAAKVYFAQAATPEPAESEQFEKQLPPEITEALVGPPLPSGYDINEILR